MLKRLSIRQKTLVVFAVVAIVPLLLINIIWLRSYQNQLKQSASERQRLLVSSSAERVDQFLNSKIDNLIIHSQIAAIQNFDIEQAQLNLIEYAKQDADLLSISLVDTSGQQRLKLERLEPSQNLVNVADSDAFKVVTFLSGKEYISSVSYDQQNQPRITVAVPLVTFTNRQTGADLSTAESGIRRSAEDIKGALIIEVSLANLWQSVLSEKLGEDGYAYIVDDKGSLIAHPNTELVRQRPDLSQVPEVQQAIATLAQEEVSDSSTAANPEVSVSETGVNVLSSHAPVNRARWAVIAEEPISSVYAAVNRSTAVAASFFLAAVLLALVLVRFSSRAITKPIQELTTGALKIGGGDLNYRIQLGSSDELGLLGQTFNRMAQSLQELLEKYRQRNLDLDSQRLRLQAVLNSMTDGVVALNQDFRIVLVNEAAIKLSGKPSSSIMDQPWLSIYRLSSSGRLLADTDLDSKEPAIEDVELTSDSDTRFLDIIVVKLPTDNNQIRYLLTIHDVTQSRQLELMRMDFVSMAAHELRTPHTAVMGYLNLLKMDEHLSAEGQIRMNRALASSAVLERLITNMLVLSKIERGQPQLKMQRLDINKLVEPAVKDYQFRAQEKQLNLIYKPSPQPAWVRADQLAIQEVVGNLLSNAVHYTPEGGRVTVEVSVDKDDVLIEVADTGIGIPNSALPQLFSKYFRVEGGLTTDSAGTGIGLYICKTLTELHNGTIAVQTRLKHGSTFSVRLPRFEKSADQ